MISEEWVERLIISNSAPLSIFFTQMLGKKTTCTQLVYASHTLLNPQGSSL